MEKKSLYESPETEIVSLRVFTPILEDDVIHQGGASADGVFDAKQQIEYEEEETLPVSKSIWEDEE